MQYTLDALGHGCWKHLGGVKNLRSASHAYKSGLHRFGLATMSAPPVQGVAGVYRHIIDDVVTRVRTEFVQEGVDECVMLLSSKHALFDHVHVGTVC